jgi:hypothetical protein
MLKLLNGSVSTKYWTRKVTSSSSIFIFSMHTGKIFTVNAYNLILNGFLTFNFIWKARGKYFFLTTLWSTTRYNDYKFFTFETLFSLHISAIITNFFPFIRKRKITFNLCCACLEWVYKFIISSSDFC